MKVYISPSYTGPDHGDGIRRVVEAQRRGLPEYGVDVCDREADADLVAVHAGSYVETRKPVVAHNHGLYWAEYAWSPQEHSLNNMVINVLRRCDAATAPSNWVAYAIKRGMNVDALTVYHGVDASEWEPDTKDHPYVLWNKTRVDAICDPTPAVEVAKRLHDVHVVATFGDSDLPNMHVTGRMPYEQAKIVVRRATVYLATARETFGIGTLEAMASGAVVVGFDWGGQAEIITNGVDGLLVPVGDYAALAQAVSRALENPGTYVHNSMDLVRRDFTWARACKTYADLYKQTFEACGDRPRTSIIITCYNLANDLPRAVESVRRQSDQDWEIVVVNDASPDDTAVVAERLADVEERIKVVTNPSNLYLAGSLDAGVQASSGRYIVPLDADNELAPGALDTLANALDGNHEIDIAYGGMTIVQEWSGGLTYDSHWPQGFDYSAQMGHRNQLPSTSMYRRKWWDRSGGYRRRCRTAEDADFWCRATSMGAVPHKVTAQPTLIYHARRDSMSVTVPDWDWTAWYPWSRHPELTPWGAPAYMQKIVPSLEPAQVTVVIPVGPGHERLLADALDSLYGQTYRQWRCVVVDDRPGADNWQSPLRLPTWVEKYITGGPGPKGGPARARNIILQTGGRTPYVLFLDADDYLAPGALEILMATALERNGVRAREYYYSDWIKQESGTVYKAPDFVAEHLRTNLTHSVTALYPVDGVRNVGGFDESLDAWEDWDFVLKLIQAGYCGVHVPHTLLYYRQTTGQRREMLYAGRATHMDAMRAKWHDLMVENKPMACGCRDGRTTYSPPVSASRGPILVRQDGMTLVEFTGTSAPRTYRGPSGREYRFGSDVGHRMHHVLNQDLGLFEHRQGFRIAVADAEGYAVLEAVGPPDREAALAVS